VKLVERLTAHDLANTRSFSTAVRDSKRPVPEPASVSLPVRHFNTSRSLKAVNDTSTIDFAYLPDFDPDTAQSPVLRVPILPETVTSQSNQESLSELIEEAVSIVSHVRQFYLS
jgi:hypothetical protein